MTARLDVVTLPNGRFVLVLSAMPYLDYGTSEDQDWRAAREELMAETGAVAVLRFSHPITVPAADGSMYETGG